MQPLIAKRRHKARDVMRANNCHNCRHAEQDQDQIPCSQCKKPKYGSYTNWEAATDEQK
jgi:hypothetical protein